MGTTRDGIQLLSSPGWTLALTTLLVCTLTQCVCQNREKDSAHPPEDTIRPAPGAGQGQTKPTTAEPTKPAEPAVELPAVLDVKDLDADERKVLAAVLDEQFDPCGEPRSFMESLKSAAPCEQARSMGKFAVGLVARGLSKKQIVRKLLAELQRTSRIVELELAGVPHLGKPDARNVLVEFLDFQCPFCKVAAARVKKLAKAHDLVVYVKHMPLTTHHPFAREAALASLAAHAQGRFFDLYDALFEHQAVLSSEKIRALATEIGLDMARYDADVKSKALADHLARDEAEADRYEVDGTPYFFLNGYAVEFEQIEEKLVQD